MENLRLRFIRGRDLLLRGVYRHAQNLPPRNAARLLRDRRVTGKPPLDRSHAPTPLPPQSLDMLSDRPKIILRPIPLPARQHMRFFFQREIDRHRWIRRLALPADRQTVQAQAKIARKNDAARAEAAQLAENELARFLDGVRPAAIIRIAEIGAAPERRLLPAFRPAQWIGFLRRLAHRRFRFRRAEVKFFSAFKLPSLSWSIASRPAQSTIGISRRMQAAIKTRRRSASFGNRLRAEITLSAALRSVGVSLGALIEELPGEGAPRSASRAFVTWEKPCLCYDRA